jgi:hypothetical protein
VEPIVGLVEGVRAGPSEFTEDTNEDAVAILNHAELNPAAPPWYMKVFKNYNGTKLCLLSQFRTHLHSQTSHFYFQTFSVSDFSNDMCSVPLDSGTQI